MAFTTRNQISPLQFLLTLSLIFCFCVYHFIFISINFHLSVKRNRSSSRPVTSRLDRTTLQSFAIRHHRQRIIDKCLHASDTRSYFKRIQLRAANLAFRFVFCSRDFSRLCDFALCKATDDLLLQIIGLIRKIQSILNTLVCNVWLIKCVLVKPNDA